MNKEQKADSGTSSPTFDNNHVSGWHGDNEKLSKAVGYLSIEANIDLNDARQVFLLIRAIEYANLDTYCTKVKSREDGVVNEIFYTKASCYWRRKMLDFNDANYIKKSNSLKEYEYYSVRNLKAQLPINR